MSVCVLSIIWLNRRVAIISRSIIRCSCCSLQFCSIVIFPNKRIYCGRYNRLLIFRNIYTGNMLNFSIYFKQVKKINMMFGIICIVNDGFTMIQIGNRSMLLICSINLIIVSIIIDTISMTIVGYSIRNINIIKCYLIFLDF